MDLAARQMTAGHRISLLLRPRRPEAGGADVHAFVPKGATVSVSRKPFDALNVWRAARTARADIIHAHLGWAARATAAAPARPPAVTTLHRHYRAKESGRLEGVIRIADWQKAAMADHRGQSVTIRNWTPNLAPASPYSIAEARASAGAGPDDILVGFVGRLHEVKGVDLLVEAFRASAPENARLVIVGEGPLKAQLAALASGDDRITLAGFTANPSAWYQAMDLFVMPSRFEPFGLTALEAMEAGAPIIASDADGPREILEGVAVLTPAGELEPLTQALEAFFLSHTSRPARKTYDQTPFDPDQAVARIEDFYNQVIAAENTRRSQPTGRAA
ncbi:glycosyltransferase [Brevundimonas sp. S30B]|nr:glycosyltransferase [Brevundimonas sp. MF30-B]TFW04132.1 glycosyltransferase [Brevundimonas sp. S30B]